MNEFQQLPNPDNVPGKVSSGYQRQNANMFAIQTGLDTTEPHDNGNGVITIPKGGIVEFNGVMFKLTATITLTKPIPSRAYWVAIEDNGEGAATAELVEYPGTWSPDKKGCYLPDGRRTLNWVSLGSLFNPAAFATVKEILLTKSSETIQLKPGWYHIYLESGAGGGNGQHGANGTNPMTGSTVNGGDGGAGGSAMNRISKDKIFFFDKSGQHEIKTGGNGTNGGSGGKGGTGTRSSSGGWRSGGGGGGGGSGSGESTSFDNFETGEVPCGEGGRGGSGGCTGGGGAGVPGGTLPNDNAYDRMRDGRTGGADNGGDGGGGDKSGVNTSDSYDYTNSAFAGRGGRGGGSLTGAAGASGMNGANGENGGGGGGGGKGLDGKYRPNGVPGGSCVVRGIRDYSEN